jgi:hypothetical protein
LKILLALVVLILSAAALLPPAIAVCPSILSVLTGTYTVGLGLDVKAWRVTIILAALGGAGVVSGIWLVSTVLRSPKST